MPKIYGAVSCYFHQSEKCGRIRISGSLCGIAFRYRNGSHEVPISCCSKGADARRLFENLKVAENTESHFEENLNKSDVIFVDVMFFVSMAANVKETVADIQADVIKELRKA